MTDNMGSYYKTRDPYQGWICTLTHIPCGGTTTCRECVFAREAFRQELERKEEGE